MSDYSRFTTTKGQLLLNIKPPSASMTPRSYQQQANNTSSIPLSDSKYIPYSGLNNVARYQGQAQMSAGGPYQMQSSRGPQVQVQNGRQVYYPDRYNLAAVGNQNQNINQLYVQPNDNILGQTVDSRHYYISQNKNQNQLPNYNNNSGQHPYL